MTDLYQIKIEQKTKHVTFLCGAQLFEKTLQTL